MNIKLFSALIGLVAASDTFYAALDQLRNGLCAAVSGLRHPESERIEAWDGLDREIQSLEDIQMGLNKLSNVELAHGLRTWKGNLKSYKVLEAMERAKQEKNKHNYCQTDVCCNYVEAGQKYCQECIDEMMSSSE